MADSKIAFSVVHRPERSPSQRFRFEQFLPDLQAAGLAYDYNSLVTAEDDRILYRPGHYAQKAGILARSLGKRLAERRRLADYRVIYVQREAFMLGTTYFERQYARSAAKFVFDFDDAIWLDNEQNVSAANRNLKFLKNPSKTAELAQIADLVVAGNEYLADYARQFNANVRVVPSTVDTDWHRPMPELRASEQVVIGWSGSMTTVQHFETLLPVLEKLKARYKDKVGFMVVGGKYENKALGIQSLPWTLATEVQSANRFDIGVMPLPDDEWTKGKCGMKGLLYMACGIPAVMADVGVNGSIVRHGENGLLAKTEADWLETLSALVESQALRQRLGAAGRQTVVERYSRKAWKDVYLGMLKP